MIEGFGCDEKVLALASAFLYAGLNGQTQSILVLVEASPIEMSVTDLNRRFQCVGHLLDVCELVGAQTD